MEKQIDAKPGARAGRKAATALLFFGLVGGGIMLAVGQRNKSGWRKARDESCHSKERVMVTMAAVGRQRDESAR